MNARKWKATLCLLAMAGLVTAGCETTGQSAGLGAGIGAVAGGIIGHQSGRGLEGAAIGAVIGGLTGAIIGNERQRRLASKAQVEQEYAQAQGTPVTYPVVVLEEYDVAPQSVKVGETVHLRGKYVVMGPPPEAGANGVIRLVKDGNEIHSAEIKEVQEGRTEIERDINIPRSLQEGDYDLQIEIMNGNSVAKESRTFHVARN